MTVHPASGPTAVQEAVAVAEAALALSGHVLDPRTRVLIAEMARHEISADQAVEQIIAHYVGRSDR